MQTSFTQYELVGCLWQQLVPERPHVKYHVVIVSDLIEADPAIK